MAAGTSETARPQYGTVRSSRATPTLQDAAHSRSDSRGTGQARSRDDCLSKATPLYAHDVPLTLTLALLKLTRQAPRGRRRGPTATSFSAAGTTTTRSTVVERASSSSVAT